jgi:AcrR family transcriptional regulator
MPRSAARPRASREEQKQERFARIREVARDLFRRKGYEATTLRMIARRAGVGPGTIFRYVADKRDLLYLLFNEEHTQVTELALARTPIGKSFLDQCIEGFRPYFDYFGRNPQLARSVLREATFYVPGQGNHAFEAMQRSVARITGIVTRARARGEIDSPQDDAALAHIIFELYQIECRRWLAVTRPDVEDGLAQLRETLAVVARGMCPRVEAGTTDAIVKTGRRPGRKESTR